MPAPDDDFDSIESERYALLNEIFSHAISLSVDDRAAFLAERCAGDASLRREVEELLDIAENGAPEVLSESRIEDAREALEGMLERAKAGPEVEPAWVPERVGPYRVLRRIAEGGMGVVYEAAQESPRRRVALKVIHPMLVTPTRLRRFRQEAEVLGRLQHPGIAQIFQAGTYDFGRGPQPYIAMEFVEGEPLDVHAKSKQLPLRARLKLMADICDAVQHANTVGVIHRDLKPDNILVDGHGWPKVLDFGIARASEGSTMLTTLVTEEGDLLGTIAYMAPEQLDGDPDAITPRSDVYGLGAVAFELLSGRAPHDLLGLPLTAALQLAREKEPSRLGDLRPELRGDVETIIGKALEKDPKRRYASASAFADDLRSFLANRPILARPPSRWYRAQMFTRRNRALVAGTAATLLAMAVGLFASLQFAARAQENQRNTEAERARVVGVLLQNTQEFLDEGDYWRAMDSFEEIGESSNGWPNRFVDAAFPPLIHQDLIKGWVHWIDEDRLVSIPANPDPVMAEFLAIDSGTGRRDFEFELAHRGDVPTIRGTDLAALRDQARTLLAEWDPAAGSAVLRRDGVEQLRINDPFLADCGRQPLYKIPGRQRLMCLHAGRGELRLYDSVTGDQLANLEGLRRSSCRRAWVREDGQEIFLWDSSLALNRVDSETLTLKERYDSIRSSSCGGGSLSLDGRFFAHAPDLRPLEVWDLETRSLVLSQELGLLPEGGHKVVFSPDASKLFVAADDRRGMVLDLPLGLTDPAAFGTKEDPRAVTFEGHQSYIYGLCLSPDSRMAASTSVPEQVTRIWDVATGREICVLPKRSSSVSTAVNHGEWLAFSPDYSRLLTTVRPSPERTSMVVWDLLAGEATETDITGPESSLSYLPGLDAFLEALDGTCRIGRKAVAPEQGPALAVQGLPARTSARGERWELFTDINDELAIDIAPDGGRVVVGAARCVRVHDHETRKALATFPGQAYAVAWSPDGRWIAAGGASGRIRLIDAERLAEVLSFPAHEDYVFALAWTPDGTRIVSASGDATARVWDVRSKEEREADLASYERRLDAVRALSREQLLREFDSRESVQLRGLIVRVLLERRL